MECANPKCKPRRYLLNGEAFGNKIEDKAYCDKCYEKILKGEMAPVTKESAHEAFLEDEQRKLEQSGYRRGRRMRA